MTGTRIHRCPECDAGFESPAALGGHKARHTLEKQKAAGYRLPSVPAPKMQPEPRKPAEPPPRPVVQWPSGPFERRPFDPERVRLNQALEEEEWEVMRG